MEYHTQQLVASKIEENPLEFDCLEYYYQDPFHNSTTSMFEAPQLDHEFKSLALPLPQDYNHIPNMGFHGFEDYNIWDFSVLDMTTTSSLPHRDYNEIDEKPHTTTLESFGVSCNGPSDLGHRQASMPTESSGFSSTQFDSVMFDEKPISTMVESSDFVNYDSSDLGNHEFLGSIESSDFSSSHCDSWDFDEMLLKKMVESLDNTVPSDPGQHEVSMMVESSDFSSSHYHSMVLNETPISTMVESFDNSSNVPSVLDHQEVSMISETSATFASSHCDALVLYENPLLTIVDSFDYSSIPTPDLGDDEESLMIESGFPSWDISGGSHKRGISKRRRYNTQMKIKSDALELEDIKKYFNLPITKAAKELKVGVTLLKRRCRELNIMRWPHRKIKSLNYLIETLKGMGMRNEVKMLEENKSILEQVPNMELTKRTKKLRQSIFKANYIKRKMSVSLLLG